MPADDQLSRLLHRLEDGSEADRDALDRIYVGVDAERGRGRRSDRRSWWRAVLRPTGQALAPIAVVVVLVLGAFSVGILVGRPAPTPAAASPSPSSAPTLTRAPLRPSAAPTVPAVRVELSGRPYRVVAAAGAIWVADGGQVDRVDPASGRIAATIRVGSGRASVGAGPAGIWVCDFNDGTVARLDPATNRLGPTVAVEAPDFVAVGESDVWIASSRTGRVTRIASAANRIVATIDAGYGPSQLVVAGDAVWVPNDQSANSTSTAQPALVTRIDPATNAVVARVTMGDASVTDFTYGREAVIVGSQVWVLDDGGGQLAAVDPATNQPVSFLPLGRHLGGLLAIGDVLWVTIQSSSGEGEVVRVVPASSAVTTSLGVAGQATSTNGLTTLAAFGSSLWVAADWSDRHELLRIDPP